jgi:hypothetical protein
MVNLLTTERRIKKIVEYIIENIYSEKPPFHFRHFTFVILYAIY